MRRSVLCHAVQCLNEDRALGTGGYVGIRDDLTPLESRLVECAAAGVDATEETPAPAPILREAHAAAERAGPTAPRRPRWGRFGASLVLVLLVVVGVFLGVVVVGLLLLP